MWWKPEVDLCLTFLFVLQKCRIILTLEYYAGFYRGDEADFVLILMFPQDIRDHARFYYCLLTNVSSKKVCKQNKWMRAFGLLYAPRRYLFFHFFLNYVDGKLTENVIAGLVCNGNLSASADTFWKVCLWNTWLSRYCISISRTNFRVRENR